MGSCGTNYWLKIAGLYKEIKKYNGEQPNGFRGTYGRDI